jgi:hypothetical protein
MSCARFGRLVGHKFSTSSGDEEDSLESFKPQDNEEEEEGLVRRKNPCDAGDSTGDSTLGSSRFFLRVPELTSSCESVLRDD